MCYQPQGQMGGMGGAGAMGNKMGTWPPSSPPYSPPPYPQSPYTHQRYYPRDMSAFNIAQLMSPSQSGGMPQTGGEQIYNAPPPQNTTPQTGGDFMISAPPPQNMTLPPMSGGIQAKPAMIPGTNRPMPPGAFIDEYGIARRAPETPFNPGAGQFGQYGQRPAGGFQGSVRNGQNFIGNTLFAPQGLNQNGGAPDANMMNFVNYMNSYRR